MANDIFQFTLAKTYLDGNDEEKALEGLETMKKLAENGNAEAAYEVGIQYSEGCLVLTDVEEAKKWYRLAVELGSEPAKAKLAALDNGSETPLEIYNRGVAYYYGEGVEQDYIKALECFLQAANAGDVDAKYALYACYAKGRGTEPDQEMALHYLREAAEGGHADAKAVLAECGHDGHESDNPPVTDDRHDDGLVPPNDKPPIEDVQHVARDLIQLTAEAFQTYLRTLHLCPNDIEARGEFGFGESIIHFFENDPQLKGLVSDPNDVDEFRRLIFSCCFSSGLIYGGKFMVAPDQIGAERLRQMIAEQGPFAFSKAIKRNYFKFSEEDEKKIINALYNEWRRIFGEFEGRPGSEQLVGCLYYVGFHLGITLMFDRRRVPEGSTLDFGNLDALLAGNPISDNVPPENPVDTPTDGDGPFPFKVGKMVQKVFPVLFDDGKVSEADIEFLMSATATKQFKTGGAQVLKETLGDPEEDAKDPNGRKRFYTKFVLSFCGKKYLLTSQWFDKSLMPVLEWLAEHGIDRSRAAQICVAAGLTPSMPDDPTGEGGDTPPNENGYPVDNSPTPPASDGTPPSSTPPSGSSSNEPPDGGKLMVECGICHEKFEPQLHELIDLDKGPDLVKRACDLSLFAQLCPHCHGMTNVPYPTTVVQASKRFMIRLSFDFNEVKAINRAKRDFLEGTELKGMRQRVVFGVPSFVEKVRIFNQGLDDNLVEAMKLLFLSQNEGKDIANMLFAGISNGQFRFLVFAKGASEPVQIGMPGEIYDKLQQDTDGKFPEGYMRFVSHVTVGKILNGETDDDKIDELKLLDVFATIGGKLGLLKQRNFNFGPWKAHAIGIASKVQEAVQKDEEICGDYNMMRNIGIFAALHIGLGASVEWVNNKTGFNIDTIFDMMMLEGEFCRVGEIPFEKLASFTNEDFETTFRKYSDALEAIGKDIAIKTNRLIDPNATEKPSQEMLAGYWELVHKEFFCAFLCGMNAGLLLQNEGAQLNVKGGVSVQIDYGKHLNLALAQNKCPLITSLKIKNVTDQKMEGLTCRISSSDDFFQTKTVEVGPLWQGAESELGSIKLNYNVGLLRKLEDAQQGSFRIEIVNGDETLFSQDYEVQALAADQSHSIWDLPIFLASFVKPNCESIHQLQSDVAREMQKIAGGDASLAGYQLDREHVFKMCAAIYRAIQKKGISYSNPASSFNLPGQKIRMPDTVFKYKLATCLDSSILFASIMEACQLHPVIIIISGHAFAGCFLADSHLPQIEMRDPQVLRKLIAANEFIAIETTMVTSDKTFEECERFGREVRLAAENDSEFYCAIDIVAARNTGVMPLALGNAAEDSEFVAEGHEVDQKGVGKLRRVDHVDLSKLKKAEAPTGRVAVWAQKLLDLSPMNKLLNAKEGKDVLLFTCPDVGMLEDWLASNYELPVRSVFEAFSSKDIEDLRKKKITNDRVRQIIEAEFSCQRLCVEDNPRAVVRALKTLYKLGQQDLEETGAHTLFAAIGFVEWRDPKKRKNASAYRAPIILVPIRIGQQRTDAGICISRRDDETVVNTTLLQFLRAQYQIEVPGLDPLPLDDAGLDVPHILQIFRECLKRAADLEVVEGAAIGHFSFGKFAMWRDLMEHHDILEQNPLVNHLINAGGRFNDGVEVFDPKEIAGHLKPDELYCPVSADSSQLTAVLYSQLGKSFVLYGPPGTGKSQTITNMIAHNLALGRRVLFVSEKKAALDVVHKRLKEVGLEPFCLELHSNKGDKGSVMAQFESALAVTKDKSADEWKQSAARIAEVRDELAGYVNALHHIYPNRLSAYDCFSKALLEGEPKFQELITADTLTQTWEQKEEQKNALKALIVEIRNTTPEALKAIPRLKDASWSIQYERNLKGAAEKLRDAAKDLCAAYGTVAAQFSLPENVADGEISRATELLKVMKAEKKALSNLGSGDVTPEKLKEMLAEAEKREARKAEVLGKQKEAKEALVGWDIEKLLIIDVKAVRSRIEDLSQSTFIMRHFKENSFLKEFAELKKSLGKLTLPELMQALVKIETLKAANKEVEKVLAENAKASESAKVDACQDDAETSALKDELVERIDRVLAAWDAYQAARGAMAEFADDQVVGDNPNAVRSVCEGLLANLGKIRGVFRYRPFRNTADQLGVSGFADKFEAGEIAARDLLKMFDDAYLGKMLVQVEETNPILPEFFGRSHEAKIEEFQRLIDKYSNLSQQAIFAQIASRYPDFSGNKFTKEENRQLGVLQREMHKKKGQMSVRSLLGDVGELVNRYKPCFLMSPLSVAQFLEMDVEPFDLIIFDEASQIEVCDAIGVMARGKQIIVVGDPQQMPPTNFFGGSVGLEALKAVEDAESILVECLDVGLPKTYLNWHYRSRHESLIAFSNHNYYEDELFSFPSVSESERLGVKFHLVKNGVYGHGINPIEAKAVVDYVCDRVKSERYRKHPRSIGIVTFNMQQQGLIEEMVEARCESDPEIKSILCGGDEAATGDEGEKTAKKSDEKMFFVRNLENVQGDEADVIIFSITFGPDENNKVSMNFGPLNRDGGERRLNVAVTRAREQMVVFSSMRYTRITTDADSALGARGLRDFLEYAQSGSRSSSCKAAVKKDAGFGNVVADFLEKHGYNVVRNVGYSGYKIDMAVLNPYNPKEYLLGIECDGPSYAQQLTVRDRDVLRSSVLARGGWKMCRVWCAEWYHDREGAEARLLELLESIKPPEPPADDNTVEDEIPEEIFVEPPVADEPEKEEDLFEKDEPPVTPPSPPVPPVPPPETPVTPPSPPKPIVPPVVPPTPVEPPVPPVVVPVPVVSPVQPVVAPPSPPQPPNNDELKVGKVVQRVFPVLFAEGRVAEQDIAYLMSEAASKAFKTGGYIVMKETTGDPDQDSRDASGAHRYYAKIVLGLNGKRYLVTSQWFATGLEPLLAWFAAHGIDRERVIEIYRQNDAVKTPVAGDDGSGRAGKTTIRVTFNDGTVLHGRKAADVFVDAIKKLDPSAVASLKILHCGEPLVTNNLADYVKYAKGAKPTGTGWYVNTYSSTQAKAQFLERIARALSIGLTVEIVPCDPVAEQPVSPVVPPETPVTPPKPVVPPVVPPTPVPPPVPPVVPTVVPPAPVPPAEPPVVPSAPVVTPPTPMVAPIKPPVNAGNTDKVYPLTEAALANIRYPLGLQIDGQEIRIVASWQDCYLSLCEKLNELDGTKFGALPEQPMFKRFFIRAIPHKKYADCYPAKLGAAGDVRAKVIGSKSYFYMPNYVVYNLLRHYGIDPQKVTIRA